MNQLGELRSLLTSKQQAEKVEILALSTDNHNDSKKLDQKLREKWPGVLDFPLLEDKNHSVIDSYGILNPDGKGWPHPATFIIDKQGIVRWKFVEVDVSKRPSREQILTTLKELR